MPGLFRAPLRHLLSAWTEIRLAEPEVADLHLDPSLPTIYVLPRPALSDALLLENYTRQHQMPAAEGRLSVDQVSVARCVALPARRLRRWPGRPAVVAPFTELIAANENVQIVPVSVFWGRAPGKEFGFWHLLAADNWQLTGRLRRALSVMVNGRDVEIQFGAPLQLADILDDREPELTNRKVARLLRVHFRRVRTRVLGPDLSHRSTLIEGVVSSPEVRHTISELQSTPNERSHGKLPRLQRRARRYGNEIASNMTYPVLRFMASALRRLWNRLYDGVDVTGLERVKQLAGDSTLVYVPCHRSHIDYLLLSYVLFRDGLMPPHIAAGRNLDMPVVGPVLRRGGAFFLRRSFRDNRLYGAVFNEYLHRLLAGGYSMEYFIEGGRSRSGRMLPPRPGMLSMTLRSFLRTQQQHARSVVFVPIYIGYERILENASYQRELGGGRKHRETPLGLLKVLGRLREEYGRVSVNIGEPLNIASFLDAQQPQWRQENDQRPDWLKDAVFELGQSLCQRINAVAALNPVNLVGLALLATPHRALEYGMLKGQLDLLCSLISPTPSRPGPTLPEGNADAWIDQVVTLGMIDRREQSLGEIITADASQAALLGWYRNNVLHLFALPALVAFSFRSYDTRSIDELTNLLSPLWPMLARELAVPVGDDLRQQLIRIVEHLVAVELLTEQSGQYQPCNSLEARERLRLLGQMIQPSLERNTLLVDTLLASPSGSLSRDELCQRSRSLAERLALLSGRAAPEFFDLRLFESLVDSLIADGWVWEEEQQLVFGSDLQHAASNAMQLLDASLQRRLAAVTGPQEKA
ncbi:hypothetical protein BJB45_02270 [Halomonas huangheensis]|uniref:Glycerol-3-phosphate acyltransferase n=2 Tax=Halomonas huangheensis TaxID=1178482 RepID=W1N475_9GAMM|nr:hypothetical protein BJB45_02270 [Halomonas huangheensis]